MLELALSATFLMMLLGAAVDLGLAYKAHQTLVNATAEASTYLDQFPAVNCGDVNLPAGDARDCADTIARGRFRQEQGDAIRGWASTLDLNADGKDDLVWGQLDITDWVKITEADTTQIDVDNNRLRAGYNPDLTDQRCKDRIGLLNNIGNGVTECYIVIRTRIIYKPFFLAPIFGNEMTIRTTSVRRIVNTMSSGTSSP